MSNSIVFYNHNCDRYLQNSSYLICAALCIALSLTIVDIVFFFLLKEAVGAFCPQTQE